MENFQKNLEKYAELVVKVALNIKNGQKLHIKAALENADFVRQITKLAYEQGAKKVYTDFYDPLIQRITYEMAPEEGLADFPDWQVERFDELIDEGGALLNVYALDPDLLKGVDAKRIAHFQKSFRKQIGTFPGSAIQRSH